MKSTGLLPVLLLASAAVPAFAQPAPPMAMTMAMPMLAGTRLDIVASADVARTPDIALISAGVVTQGAGAAAALAENADRMARAIAALERAGVARRDIQTASISLSPQYRYGENMPPVITGYQASNQVSVRFRDVARAGAILDALVAAGANQISGPNLMIDKPEAALDEARAAAIATARARAALYASAAGLKVKRIIAISESGAEPPPMPMPGLVAMRAEKSDTSIEPGEQRIGVALSVSFELE